MRQGLTQVLDGVSPTFLMDGQDSAVDQTDVQDQRIGFLLKRDIKIAACGLELGRQFLLSSSFARCVAAQQSSPGKIWPPLQTDSQGFLAFNQLAALQMAQGLDIASPEVF